jgi:hypothetical protein
MIWKIKAQKKNEAFKKDRKFRKKKMQHPF